MTDEERVQQHLVEMFKAAQARYSQMCDDVLRDHAILTRDGRLSPAHQNRLTFDALALCGDPHCQFSRTIWSDSAWKFLAQFTKGE